MLLVLGAVRAISCYCKGIRVLALACYCKGRHVLALAVRCTVCVLGRGIGVIMRSHAELIIRHCEARQGFTGHPVVAELQDTYFGPYHPPTAEL